MKGIRTRLVVAFTLFGVTPYLLIMIYFSYWEQHQIIKAVHNDYKLKATHSKTMIDTALIALDEEITFLAHLEVMDDMISKDIDLQIARLLTQKSFRANEKYMELYTLDPQGHIVASSLQKNSSQTSPLTRQQLKEHNFLQDETLYFVKALHSSFDTRHLGYLVATFEIRNLNAYLLQSVDTHFSIAKIVHKNSMEDATYIYDTVPFTELLKGYGIGYKIVKSEVLGDVYDFLRYLLALSLIGIIIIVFMSRKITHMITKPIYELKETAGEIVATKNFHLRIKPFEVEEFDDLGTRFNLLFESTQILLQQLETESENRLKKYIGLTHTFNAISNTTTQEKSVTLALDALQENLHHDIELVHKKNVGNSFQEITYYDYVKGKKEFFGSFNITQRDTLSDHEVIFINAVSLMLKNHLERMSLLQQMDAASNAKSDFISAMSHELRTPLNAIIGYAQFMIQYETLSEDQVDTIAKMETAGYHLLEIINDILDIAKIEAGKIEVHRERLPIKNEIQETVDITQTLAQEKNLMFHCDLEAVTDLSIVTDKKILKQILINLLSNAIKFTNEGSVTLATSVRSTSLIIEVKDSGIGIEADDLEKMFDSFTQLKNSKKSQAKGSGLGLALCKQLSEVIEADLTITSEGIDKGSCATLTLNL